MLDKCQQMDSHPLQRAVTQNDAYEHKCRGGYQEIMTKAGVKKQSYKQTKGECNHEQLGQTQKEGAGVEAEEILLI